MISCLPSSKTGPLGGRRNRTAAGGVIVIIPPGYGIEWSVSASRALRALGSKIIRSRVIVVVNPDDWGIDGNLDGLHGVLEDTYGMSSDPSIKYMEFTAQTPAELWFLMTSTIDSLHKRKSD